MSTTTEPWDDEGITTLISELIKVGQDHVSEAIGPFGVSEIIKITPEAINGFSVTMQNGQRFQVVVMQEESQTDDLDEVFVIADHIEFVHERELAGLLSKEELLKMHADMHARESLGQYGHFHASVDQCDSFELTT